MSFLWHYLNCVGPYNNLGIPKPSSQWPVQEESLTQLLITKVYLVAIKAQLKKKLNYSA